MHISDNSMVYKWNKFYFLKKKKKTYVSLLDPKKKKKLLMFLSVIFIKCSLCAKKALKFHKD